MAARGERDLRGGTVLNRFAIENAFQWEGLRVLNNVARYQARSKRVRVICWRYWLSQLM